MKQTSTSTAVIEDSCWSNGTKVETADDSSSIMVDKVTTVRGQTAVCYAIEVRSAIPPTTIAYIWKAPNGTILATGSVDPATPNIFNISCNSRTYDVDTNSAVCQGQSVVPGCSTDGTCSF